MMKINSFNTTFNNPYTESGINNHKNAVTQPISGAEKDSSGKSYKTGISLLAIAGLALLLRKKIGKQIKKVKNVILPRNFEKERDIFLERLEKLKDEYGSSWQPVKSKDGKTLRDTMLGQNIKLLKEKIYNKLRLSSYPVSGDPKISDFAGRSTSKIKASSQNGWIYRTPITSVPFDNPHSVERISLNVRPEKALLEKLDEYFVTNVGTVQGKYKVPEAFSSWSERHDPITIYLYRSARKSNVLQDIAEIVKPYVRENGSSCLLGKKYANGCAWQLSPTQADKMKIIERIRALFGEKAADKVLGYNRFGKVSSGEVVAYNELLNRITGQSIKVLEP